MKSMNFKEKVFIAWGGNQPLAVAVSKELAEMGFDGIVGGGSPTDMFIGTQVFSQIKICTQAIILVENNNEGSINYNDNLMFEWGYLVAKLSPDKVHVFLLDLSTKDLPSDLAGSWAKEVDKQNRDIQDIAAEITQHFLQNIPKKDSTNKLDYIHNWFQIGKFAQVYETEPICSDSEFSRVLLHGITGVYGSMEEDTLKHWLTLFRPESSALEFTMQFISARISLFEVTETMQKPLSFDQFSDFKLVFDANFDLSFYDEDLDAWLHMGHHNMMGVLYYCISKNEELSEKESEMYLREAIKHAEKAMETLHNICEKFPNDKSYVGLYQSYLSRNIYLCYMALGERDKAKAILAESVEWRKQFYLNYKRLFPQDILLNKHFMQEYYLALIEQLDLIDDEFEAITIKRTVMSYLSKLENETDKQHTVLNLIKDRLSKV